MSDNLSDRNVGSKTLLELPELHKELDSKNKELDSKNVRFRLLSKKTHEEMGIEDVVKPIIVLCRSVIPLLLALIMGGGGIFTIAVKENNILGTFFLTIAGAALGYCAGYEHEYKEEKFLDIYELMTEIEELNKKIKEKTNSGK